MRIFLIEFGVELENTINPVFKYQLTCEDDIKHAALVLDQTIFGARQAVDWVLFAKSEHIKWEKFLQMETYVPIDSKTVISPTGNQLDSFYCRPAVFSIFGNMYKVSEPMFRSFARQRIDIQWI